MLIKRSSHTRLAGSLLFSGGLVFFIFNTVAEGIFPNYSVRTNALSDLGALGAPTRFLWDGQLFVSGVLTLLGMFLLFFRSSWAMNTVGRRRNLIGILFLLPSIGSILVSLFPENFVLAIHALGALIVFLMGGIIAIIAYKLTEPPFRYFSVLLGIIALASTFLLESGAAFGFGLVERMIVYPIVIWSIAFGSYLMALSS